MYDPTKHTTHRDLIGLVDKYLKFEYYQDHTKNDSARLKCLSGNGTLTWTDVAQNDIYGRKFTNQQSLL